MECCWCNNKLIKLYINNSENNVSNDTTVKGLMLKCYSLSGTDVLILDPGPLTSVILPSSTNRIEIFWINRKMENIFIQREEAPFQDNIKIKQI